MSVGGSRAASPPDPGEGIADGPNRAPSIPDHVHVGRDGHLFLIHGSNDAIEQYAGTDLAVGMRWLWREAVWKRERRLRAMGITYRHVVAPEKLTIYDHRVDGLAYDAVRSPARLLVTEDLLPETNPLRVRSFVRHLRRRARWRRTCIDLVEPLRRARDRELLYWRTDTHWTFAGRLVAYRAICKALRARPRRDFATRPAVHDPAYVGDLGRAFDPPRSEGTLIHRLWRDAELIYRSPIVEARERAGTLGTLHGGAHVVYRTARASDRRRLVLFGDSYANYNESMLTIMLAETFREVHFIWSPSVDWAYIERVRPDIVLTEVAERFMTRLPQDDAYSVEAEALERFGAELAAAAERPDQRRA